jgi:hypothetical protein
MPRTTPSIEGSRAERCWHPCALGETDRLLATARVAAGLHHSTRATRSEVPCARPSAGCDPPPADRSVSASLTNTSALLMAASRAKFDAQASETCASCSMAARYSFQVQPLGARTRSSSYDGYQPVMSPHTMTPSANTSEIGPYGCCAIISGARKPCVPQEVCGDTGAVSAAGVERDGEAYPLHDGLLEDGALPEVAELAGADRRATEARVRVDVRGQEDQDVARLEIPGVRQQKTRAAREHPTYAPRRASGGNGGQMRSGERTLWLRLPLPFGMISHTRTLQPGTATYAGHRC